jgi:hypothetical protein
VNELLDVRNRWAHQEPFTNDDTGRALDTAQRLLEAVTAPEADEVRRMKADLQRPEDDPTPSQPPVRGERPSALEFPEYVAAAGPDATEVLRLMDGIAEEFGLRIAQSHAARKYRVGKDGPVAWVQPQQGMLFFDLRTLALGSPNSEVTELSAQPARLSSRPSQSDMPGIPFEDVSRNWPSLLEAVVQPFFGFHGLENSND